MKNYLIIFCLLLCFGTNSQNLIKNYSFEDGNPKSFSNVFEGDNYIGAVNFRHNIDYWQSRMPSKLLLHSGYNTIWHSPDWSFGVNPRHVGIRSYELVQQELSTELIYGAYYLIKFKYRWHDYSDDVNLEFYLSQNELKYKKERLLLWQNEENHLCSDDYKSFDSEAGSDYYVVACLENLINQSDVNGEWYSHEEIIQIPQNGTFHWFGFQTVLKDDSNVDVCYAGYLKIDEIELELLHCSDDPCSPTDGDINIHSFIHPQYGYCFCNLNNISKLSNFRVYSNTLGQGAIYTHGDVECINGIMDTICWNGRNNNNAPVAPAWYFIKFDVTNDCGTFNKNYSLLHTQGTNFISKTPYLCNNSVYLPIECCGHEPDVYIYDEVFTGAGYADLIAMNSITAEDITVETSVDHVHFQAGDYIEITDAIIDGDFIAEIKPCEPLYNRAFSNNIQKINYPENVEFTETNYTANEIGDLDEKHSFQIYPNPAENILYVISDNGGRVNFAIYDVYGKKRISGTGYNAISIDITELNSGLYVISIRSTKHIYNSKFLKK
jgi:hypothetical protein